MNLVDASDLINCLASVARDLQRGTPAASILRHIKGVMVKWPESSDAWAVLDWASMLLNRHPARTARAYLLAVLPVVKAFPAVPPMEWASEQLRFVYRFHPYRSPRSQAQVIAACGSLIRYCAQVTGRSADHVDLWRRTPRKPPLTNVAVVSDEDVDRWLRLLSSANINRLRLGMAMTLAAYWGLRASEIADLAVGDVLIAEVITLAVLGKRAKYREVPQVRVPRQIVDTVRRYWDVRFAECEDESASFLALTERAIRDGASRVMSDMPNQTHTPKSGHRSIHDLRHWYSNRLHSLGIAVSDIARLLGHSSPMTTVESYLHHLHAPNTASEFAMRPAPPLSRVALSSLMGITDRHLRRLAATRTNPLLTPDTPVF